MKFASNMWSFEHFCDILIRMSDTDLFDMLIWFCEVYLDRGQWRVWIVFFSRHIKVSWFDKKNIIRIMYSSTRQTLELNRQKQMKKFKLTDYRLVVNIFIICLGFFWAGTCCIVDIETDQCLILIGEMSAFGFFSFRSYIVCE